MQQSCLHEVMRTTVKNKTIKTVKQTNPNNPKMDSKEPANSHADVGVCLWGVTSLDPQLSFQAGCSSKLTLCIYRKTKITFNAFG